MYFNRQLRLLERQYLLYLRNDMTTWDPMVVEYMERQLLVDEKSTSTNSREGDSTTTRRGTTSHESSGTDVVDTTGNSGNTRTLDTQRTTNGTTSLSGTDRVERDSTRTDNLTHTRDLTDTRTDDTTTTGSESEMKSDVSDTKHLEGATPDSSTYGTGSTIGIAPPEVGMPEISHEVGAPGKLNWTYTGGQAEDVAVADSVTRSSTETKNTGTVSSVSSGNTSDSGTVDTVESASTTYGRKETDQSSVDESGTISDQGTRTDKQTTKYGRVLTDTNDMTDSQATSGTETGESSRDTTHKERYTGRHESPTELLRKAQAYIIGSNSLKWLLDNLETCFLQVWEAW